MNNYTIPYVLLRLAIGASMFAHGLVRMPKLAGFSAWMLKNFEKSILPQVMVKPFSYALPVAELVIGILLLVGLFTRQALVAGGMVMIILVFGSGMIEDWSAIPSQLIHALFFAGLLAFVGHNRYALDNLIRHNSR